MTRFKRKGLKTETEILFSNIEKIHKKNFFLLKRESQQNPQDLESGASADRLGTNFFGFPIQK